MILEDRIYNYFETSYAAKGIPFEGKHMKVLCKELVKLQGEVIAEGVVKLVDDGDAAWYKIGNEWIDNKLKNYEGKKVIIRLEVQDE